MPTLVTLACNTGVPEISSVCGATRDCIPTIGDARPHESSDKPHTEAVGRRSLLFSLNAPNRPGDDAAFYEQSPWPFAVTIHAVFARAGV